MFNSQYTIHCTDWGIKYSQDRNLNAVNLENSKVKCLNLDDRNVFNLGPYALSSFSNVSYVSVKGHLPKD